MCRLIKVHDVDVEDGGDMGLPGLPKAMATDISVEFCLALAVGSITDQVTHRDDGRFASDSGCSHGSDTFGVDGFVATHLERMDLWWPHPHLHFRACATDICSHGGLRSYLKCRASQNCGVSDGGSNCEPHPQTRGHDYSGTVIVDTYPVTVIVDAVGSSGYKFMNPIPQDMSS